MRRRVFALFLAGTMLVSAGCSATVSMDEKGTVTVDDIRYTYDESEYTGGRPWLDTCIKENVSKDMETSPKDDFYLYVNHDWACCTEIMEGESRATVFDALDSAVLEKALSLLKDDTLDGHDASLAQGYFNAFLDWDARNEAGIEPVRDTVKRIRDIRTIEDLNGFILDSDNSWGVPVFMIIENAPNLKDAQNYITEIVHGNFLLEDAAEYTDRTAYGDIMYESGLKIAEAMLTRLGYSGQDAREMFDRAIGLEGELAEVSFTVEDEYQPWYYEKTYNVYEAGSLDELSPVFPLADLLKSRGYGEAELICIDEPEAIVKLNEIYTEDNLEVIKDYMLVGYLIKCSKILDREAYDVHCESENIKKGTTGRMSDEEAAYGCMMERFFVPMDRLYLSVYDASELKTRITEICEQTITAYKEMLEDEDWLTEETRNNAIEKLDNITINAVYPDCWDDYSGLDLSGLGYYDCVKASEQYMDRLDSENAGRKINKKIWNKYSDILKSNAFYYPYDNSVTITLGLCGKPVYYNGMSDEELLGGIGIVIGHEISHAFDPIGSEFDKYGNLSDWWAEEDRAAFDKRVDKLIDYYDNIVIWDGVNANGSMLKGEAMADMAGVKAMLRIAESKDDFDYDRFFTSYAEFWKEISTPEIQYVHIVQDSHPISYLRVNVSLQQYDEFIETYDIREDDNMYLAPEDRILVW